MFTKNDQLAVNAIRCLSLAQIEKAVDIQDFLWEQVLWLMFCLIKF